MKLQKYTSYDEYLSKQKKILKKRGKGPYFCDYVIGDICTWINSHEMTIENGICHGARCGRECDAFFRRFPDSVILGTDLVPKSGKAARFKTLCDVIEHDFMQRRNDWIGKFDFVYSNSFDHVYNPVQALDVWLEQLSKDGKLFWQWVMGNVGSGDGFGAHLDECIELAENCGKVDDLIFTRGMSRRCWGPVTVLVISKKDEES